MEAPGINRTLESITMVLLMKFARLLANLNDAFTEALEARRLARNKYRYTPEE
jgi:hypothetical protein